MAGGMKTLAKETVIYGGTTIVQKSLSWFLALFYTYVLPSQADMGVFNNFYAWIALFQVILTYGMETGFFRFANKENENPDKVFSTTITSLLCTTLLFVALAISFVNPIASGLNVSDKQHLVIMMTLILALDVISAIPFAYLRYKNRPIRFATVKISNIVVTIILNLFFFLACPVLQKQFPDSFARFSLDNSIEYILISNLIASVFQTIFVFAQVRIKYQFGGTNLLKRMLKYSLPLLILGMAGILNQNASIILFPEIYPDPSPDKHAAYSELGIYSAAMKIAIILIVMTQAFRYAFEPFIFSKNRDKVDNKQSYANATKYFIIFGLFVMLFVIGYLDIIKYLIKSTYHKGLIVIPIVMMGEIFFSIYFNLSLWYKLTDKTKWGAYMSLIGLAITLAINIIFIPKYSYMACAWASFLANLVMMLISYFMGQKYYPIKYDLKSAAFFMIITIVILAIFIYGFVYIDKEWVRLIINTVLLISYVIIALKKGFPKELLKRLPLLGKFVK